MPETERKEVEAIFINILIEYPYYVLC